MAHPLLATSRRPDDPRAADEPRRYRPTRALRGEPKPPPLTDGQVDRLREEDWLREHEELGRPIRLIARLRETSKSRVERGVARARQTREAVADASRWEADRT